MARDESQRRNGLQMKEWEVGRGEAPEQKSLVGRERWREGQMDRGGREREGGREGERDRDTERERTMFVENKITFK